MIEEKDRRNDNKLQVEQDVRKGPGLFIVLENFVDNMIDNIIFNVCYLFRELFLLIWASNIWMFVPTIIVWIIYFKTR